MTRSALERLALAVVAASCLRTPDAALPAVDGAMASHVRAPGSGVSVEVHPGGALVEVGPRRFGLVSTGLGRGDDTLEALHTGTVRAHEGGAEVDRGAGVVEFFRPSAHGVEHGYRLARRPAGAGPLRLVLGLEGAVARHAEGGSLALVDARGRTLGRYGALYVEDADGAAVPAWFEGAGATFALVLDDRAARYPLVVDPLLYGGFDKRFATDRASDDRFGEAVALAGDGSRLVVGARYRDGAAGLDVGAVYVARLEPTGFVGEARLEAPVAAASDLFGGAVSVDGTGDRVAVGADARDVGGATDAGTVYVYARTGSAWQLEAELAPAQLLTGDRFGRAVALSADGTRLAVGAVGDDEPAMPATTGNGVVYVFARTGSSWTEEARLFAGDRGVDDFFGGTLALDATATRLAVGADSQSESSGVATTNNGAAYVYVRDGVSWSEEARLVAPDRASNDALGRGLALSADGATLVAGAPLDDDGATGASNAGSAHVFQRDVAAWVHRARLVDAAPAASDTFGDALALRADGLRLVVGVPSSDAVGIDAGALAVFERTSTSDDFVAIGHVSAPDAEAADGFGAAVASTADGSRVAVSAPMDDEATPPASTDGGAVYVVEAGGRGAPCTGPVDCLSGACVDGVCCVDACGGADPGRCVACSRARTGAPDGTCAPLSAAQAPAVVCRPAAGACDVAETCVAGSASCPADAVALAATACRPAAGACDVAEACDGSDPVCPPDVRVAGGVVCRAGVGACDVAESCDGQSGVCPADARLAAGTVCRASVGPCDLEERCDGAAVGCPGDALQQSGVVCRAVRGPCDLPESCDGVLASCPLDGRAAAGTACRGAAHACDLAEACDGVADACPVDAVRPDGTPCDDGRVCSVSSACTGGTCAAATVLDCTDGDGCTTDGCVEPRGCVYVTVPACLLDAGPGDASIDATVAPDAGPTTSAAGCSCRVTPRPRPLAPVAVAVGLGLAWLGCRRLRRRRAARLHAGHPGKSSVHR